MSEETVVRQCAPTLAGIKTGSLFPCKYEDEQQLLAEIREMNRILVPKGLCLLPARYENGQALLYLYRPMRLQQDLSDGLACRLLEEAGYPRHNCARCVARLVQRLRRGGDFPHEVGLFLSYPPEDVEGFIRHKAACYKCAGLWKVYSDVPRARRMFADFKRCTDVYCCSYRRGMGLEQLSVSC